MTPSRQFHPALAALAVALLLALSQARAGAQDQNTPPAVTEPSNSPATAPSSTAPAAAPAAAAVPAAAEPVPAPVELDPQFLEEVQQPVRHMTEAAGALEKSVADAQSDDPELTRLRIEIEALLSAADLFLDSLKPRFDTVRSQSEKLGPPPAKDAAPEARQIAAERAKLNMVSAELDGAIKATGLVQYRARELLARVQDYRQGIFTRQLFRQMDSPLSPSTWRQVGAAMPGAILDINTISTRWWHAAKDNWLALIGVLLASLAAYVVLSVLSGRLIALRLTAIGDTEPSYFHRAATAGWVAPVLALPTGAAAALLAFGLDSLGLLFLGAERLVLTALPALLVFVGVKALALALLQPGRPRWRLFDLADAPARALVRALTFIAAFYAFDFVSKEVIRILALPLPVSVAEALVASVGLAVLLFSIVLTRFDPHPRAVHTRAPDDATDMLDEARPDPAPVPLLVPLVIKLPLLAVAIAILTASLLGYVALGRFIAGQVIVTGSAVVLVILLHLGIRALGQGEQGARLTRLLDDNLGLDEMQARILSRVLLLVLNVLLALVALPLILLTWGFTFVDIMAWMKAAIFGFEIGQFRVSLARIAIALVLFAALLFATRILQRWLSRTVLSQPTLDRGIANSIHTAVGYAGFALAGLVALSYSGLDITSFAIVAGALSVGIGFGLQSIVNNFVSGLILLVERPVKVGDLVSVNGNVGRVRNIAVRSTEIETGDKASLIVPNSELITSTVTNWTHRNDLARVHIKVAASYRSDPEKVRGCLLGVLSECPHILQKPKPDVSFDNFGPNGFEFSMSAIVAEMGKSGVAQTDIRLRVVRAFRLAGIEMPNAQHDVHLRDLDGLRAVLNRVSEDRAKQSQSAASPPADGPAATPHVVSAVDSVVAAPKRRKPF